jgi:hypothetical protein
MLEGARGLEDGRIHGVVNDTSMGMPTKPIDRGLVWLSIPQAENPFKSWTVWSVTFQELFLGTCGLKISVLLRTQPLIEIGSGSTVMPTVR